MATNRGRNDLHERLENAWRWVLTHFPFRGYVKADRKGSYVLLARTATACLPEGAHILDFGAGPCDKTAIFSRIGFAVTAFDDLKDPWHLVPQNRRAILAFAEQAGIRYCTPAEDAGPGAFGDLVLPHTSFDMIMLHHVLEHLHDSPRALLAALIERLRAGGILFVTVPNAVNLRKRLAVVLGRTNYPAFSAYFWYPGSWRGHVREYVRQDLELLAQFLGLELIRVGTYNHFWHAVPKSLRPAVWLLGHLVPGFRDSWLMLAKKPAGWAPPPDRLSGDALVRALGKSEYFDYGSFQ